MCLIINVLNFVHREITLCNKIKFYNFSLDILNTPHCEYLFFTLTIFLYFYKIKKL